MATQTVSDTMTSAAAGPDEDWMRVALEQARMAAEHDDVPIGCVVVDGHGQQLAAGHNRREVDADPTAHAELLALRSACEGRGHWRLDDCTLYVTLEPCPMCAGALVNARIGRLVFGAFDAKAGGIVSVYQMASDTRLNHRFPFLGGTLEPECKGLLQRFFRRLRAEGQK